MITFKKMFFVCASSLLFCYLASAGDDQTNKTLDQRRDEAAQYFKQAQQATKDGYWVDAQRFATLAQNDYAALRVSEDDPVRKAEYEKFEEFSKTLTANSIKRQGEWNWFW
jgi:hypothetical protein